MEKSLAVKNCWLKDCWVVPWASSSPKSFQEYSSPLSSPQMWQNTCSWKITALSFTLMEVYSWNFQCSAILLEGSFWNCLSTRSGALCLQVTQVQRYWSLQLLSRVFHKAWRRMGTEGDRSRRLKQVWALRTEEAVQSSERFEWNDIVSLCVCLCLSFIFKWVCCQFSHSFWKHFENVSTWKIQNWISLREIGSLKNIFLTFSQPFKIHITYISLIVWLSKNYKHKFEFLFLFWC